MIGALRRTDVHPTAVIVYRDYTTSGGAPHKGYQVPRFSGQAPAPVDAETSPTPVPYSSFDGVGKLTHSRWLNQVLAIREKLSVRASEVNGSALVKKVPSALVVGMPASAGQRPVRESINIESPHAGTYSSLATLSPTPGGSLAYRKLGG